MDTSFNYYDFRVKMAKKQVNEEIAFFEKNKYGNVAPICEYLTYLRGRLGIDRKDFRPMMRYDGTGNRCEIKKLDMDEYYKDLKVIVFKKPWNKLMEFHKMMKIKEFIDDLGYGKKVNKNRKIRNRIHLKREICNGVRDKKFGKNKSIVEYDPKNMVIESISCLIFDKRSGLYEVDWNE